MAMHAIPWYDDNIVRVTLSLSLSSCCTFLADLTLIDPDDPPDPPLAPFARINQASGGLVYEGEENDDTVFPPPGERM